MITFAIYAVIFTLILFYNGAFGSMSDDVLNKKKLSILYLLKILAVPAFYFFYKLVYGGIDNLDAGKFYHDAVILNQLAYENPGEYLKMLFGFQDDSEGSYFFKRCIDTTHNWSNGQIKDFFYNDNRVVIRVHSLLHFIAFNSYFVHALFSCTLSFMGSFYIYKSFKEFFQKKELLLMLGVCFFPALWLYCGGLLKEGLTIFFLGLIIYNLKLFFTQRKSISRLILLMLLLFLAFHLKPYLLLFSFIVFALFYVIQLKTLKYKKTIFILSLAAFTIALNFAALLIKDKTLLEAAYKREKEFQDLSTGGIFLLDSTKFIRVPYDTNNVIRVAEKENYYRIRKGVPYTYWEHHHQEDTLYCTSNTDAVSTYSLVYRLPKAGSAINIIGNSESVVIIAGRCLYYTLLHPFFFNAGNVMQIFASFENLLLLLSVILSIIGLLFSKTNTFPAFVFLVFGLSLFIIIGFTTPNSGAIMRYRSPAAIFLLMSALYFFNETHDFVRKKSN